MTVIRLRSIAALLSLSLTATAAVAGARPGDGPGALPSRSTATVRAEVRISLDEAVARVERKYEARAVRAEAKTQGGRTVYRIRLLSGDGRVFEVKVDAETGDID